MRVELVMIFQDSVGVCDGGRLGCGPVCAFGEGGGTARVRIEPVGFYQHIGEFCDGTWVGCGTVCAVGEGGGTARVCELSL